MSPEVISWIGSVSTLATLTQGWVELAKSAIELKKSQAEFQRDREALVASVANTPPDPKLTQALAAEPRIVI